MGPDAGMPPMPQQPQPPMNDVGGLENEQPPMETPGNPDEDGFGPKKDIQQQAGTLSQSLGEYNDSQEQPDTELNKYVMNMLAKQAGKALTPKDKRDVMKKLNSADEDTAEDMEAEANMEMDDEQQQQVESRKFGKIIDEVLNDVLGPKRQTKRKKVQNNDVTEKNPYVNGIER